MKMDTADNTYTRPFKRLIYKNDDISLQLNCPGNNEYAKISFPVKYCIFSRLETDNFIFDFNLNHEIVHAISKSRDWIHPSEWLKRTIGNDWIYYSTGGYSGVYEALGEYYLPNLPYPSNSLLGGRPLETGPVRQLITNWYNVATQLKPVEMSDAFSQWFDGLKKSTPDKLEQKADSLFRIIGSRVNVMPPDARHVDYNIIPITIADGCIYKCKFCKVKNQKTFSARSEKNISSQINSLKNLYGENIINYNAIFLGEHDALNTPAEILFNTIKQADNVFDFQNSFMKGRYLFFFGSVDSLLAKQQNFFKKLNQTGFQTYINIGLESSDQVTLDFLGKPLTSQKVKQAFAKIQEINTRYFNIEITCNFIMDDELPASHYPAMMELVRQSVNHPQAKGTVYLSPLKFGSPSRLVLYDFYKLKAKSRFPTFLYLIQRL